MATPRSQRIGIWIIAGAMLVGTLGGFIAMMVAPGNEAKDQAALEAARAEYAKATEERQRKVDAQTAELSTTYFAEFSAFSSRVAAFSKDDIKELKTEDLKAGDGSEIVADTVFSVYYIGWNPEGVVFDQSIDGDSLKEPFSIDGPADTSVIEGWKKGLIGMRVGGVRELTIPSAQAYGEAGSGDDIPANTPLKFIVMAIPRSEEIPAVEMPERLRKEYAKYGISS